MQLDKLQTEEIIYLNEKEERQKGGSLNHIPFGY